MTSHWSPLPLLEIPVFSTTTAGNTSILHYHCWKYQYSPLPLLEIPVFSTTTAGNTSVHCWKYQCSPRTTTAGNTSVHCWKYQCSPLPWHCWKYQCSPLPLLEIPVFSTTTAGNTSVLHYHCWKYQCSLLCPQKTILESWKLLNLITDLSHALNQEYIIWEGEYVL